VVPVDRNLSHLNVFGPLGGHCWLPELQSTEEWHNDDDKQQTAEAKHTGVPKIQCFMQLKHQHNFFLLSSVQEALLIFTHVKRKKLKK
jgi:hypothetical protein